MTLVEEKVLDENETIMTKTNGHIVWIVQWIRFIRVVLRNFDWTVTLYSCDKGCIES